MQIKSYYYEWKSDIFESKVKLGDSKEILLQSNLIEEIVDIQIQEVIYRGIDKNPYQVKFKDSKVVQIWYRSNFNTFEIDDIDLFDKFIPEALPILDKYFKNISNDIRSLEDMKSYNKSDILWIHSGDAIIRFIIILRNKHISSINDTSL